jgi:hypothetical protein
MTRKGQLRRLERAASGQIASFSLQDGSRHYFSRESGECFLHACACVRAGARGEPFPDPPDTIKALTKARNREAALEMVAGSLFPYEIEPLLERGELVEAERIHG